MTGTTRTTITLPDDLLEQVDGAVHDGIAPTRNALVARALRHELAAQRRAAIDACFARMADDDDYQAETLTIAEAFAAADSEAFRLAELSR